MTSRPVLHRPVLYRLGLTTADGLPTRRAALIAPAISLLTTTGVALWLYS